MPSRLRPLGSTSHAKSSAAASSKAMLMMGSLNEDPLARALRPPTNESVQAKAERQRAEQLAKKRSDDIDKALKEEGARRKKEAALEQRILLLGQAGAGKTTVLKQMRLLYDSSAHQRDRRSWKIVIYLNLIVAVRALLEAFEEVMSTGLLGSGSGSGPMGASSANGSSVALDQDSEELAQHQRQQQPVGMVGSQDTTLSYHAAAHPDTFYPRAAMTSSSGDSQRSGSSSAGSSGNNSPANTALLARLRLAPLLSLEADLRARLGAVDEQVDLADPAVASAALRASRACQERDPASLSKGRMRSGTASSLLLRAGWQDRLLGRSTITMEGNETMSLSGSTASGRTRSRLRRLPGMPGRRRSASFVGGIREAENEENVPLPPIPSLPGPNQVQSTREEDVGRLLQASVDDVDSLWRDERVRRLRRAQKIDERAEGASYFLDNMQRICSPDFFPTDDDIMRARVRTVGITEDRFNVDRNTIYRIFDVGGSRSQRNVWSSFFEDARGIIFLAPISAFDQRLIEDPRVNRVEDSLNLFGQLVESPLLVKVSLILFLNKMDVLERKLAAGIRVRRYFPDYEGATADFESVWRFFRTKFRDVLHSQRALAPKRACYIHTTCATSTKQIKAILSSVQDTIVRENLQSAGMV